MPHYNQEHLNNRDEKTGKWKPSSGLEYEWLYDYPKVKEMLNALRTQATLTNYATCLSVFFRKMEIKPDEFLTLDDTRIYNLVTDYFRLLEKIGTTAMGHHTKYAIKKLLKRVGRDLEIRSEDDIVHIITRTISDKKHIPNKEEIFKMVDLTTNMRNKALILCLFQSGLRVGSLIQLKYGMIRKYLFDEEGNRNSPPEAPIPIRVGKRQEHNTLRDGKVSKHIGVYYTYVGQESAEALQDWIIWLRENEELYIEDEDHVFISMGFIGDKYIVPRNEYFKRPAQPSKISRVLRKLAKKMGIKKRVWTHLLRASFQNFVDRQTGDPVFSQLLMGHKLMVGISSSHYGEYDNTTEKREMYSKINWTRASLQRVWELEQNARYRNGRIKELETQLEARDQQFEQVSQVLKAHEALLTQLQKKLEEQ